MKTPSREQEDRIAQRYRGSRQPGSGSGWKRKNDVRTIDILFEAKKRYDPNARQITIKLDDLLDVMRNATLEGRTGVLTFELSGHEFVILADVDFHAMVVDDEA